MSRPRPFTHLFFDPGHRWPRLKGGIPCCYLCGAVKRRAGAPSSGCPGQVRVTLRSKDQPVAAMEG